MALTNEKGKNCVKWSSSPETRVFILVALARVNMSQPMTQVYTRERHANKSTRFWATYGFTFKSCVTR